MLPSKKLTPDELNFVRLILKSVTVVLMLVAYTSRTRAVRSDIDDFCVHADYMVNKLMP